MKGSKKKKDKDDKNQQFLPFISGLQKMGFVAFCHETLHYILSSLILFKFHFQNAISPSHSFCIEIQNSLLFPHFYVF